MNLRTGNNRLSQSSSPEEQLARFKAKLAGARERLAVLKSDRERLVQDLKSFNVTTAEQARKKAAALQKEAEGLDQAASVLLDRAGKLLERFEG